MSKDTDPPADPTSEVSSAPAPAPAPKAEPVPTPAPATAPKPGKAPAPRGIPPHVLAAMGGQPFAPPPAAAQTAPRAPRAVRQDAGGLLAGPSPQSRQVRRQIEQVRTQLSQLVRTCDTAMQTLLPALGGISLSPEICASEGFDPAAAMQFIEALRVTLEAHFPHAPRA